MTDTIWCLIGLVFGYVIGYNRKQDNLPKELERCNVNKSQLETDVNYYKKLTRDLVAENKSLRIKLDGNKNTKNKKK